MNQFWNYIIIERSYNMAVLETGYGTQEQAWEKANKIGQQFSDIIEDYDVLFFATRREMYEFIMRDARESCKEAAS